LGVRYGVRAANRPNLAPPPSLVEDTGTAPSSPAVALPAAAGVDIATRLRAALRLRSVTAINNLSSDLSTQPATSALGERIGELAQAFDFKGLERVAAGLEEAAGAMRRAGV
jgi:hypothetical protein